MYNKFIKIMLYTIILLFGSSHGYARKPPCTESAYHQSASSSQNIKFNFSGLKRGAVSSSCYHNPCSISRVVSFKYLESTPEYSRIELKLLGGEKAWESKRIRWNSHQYSVIITCSIQRPSIQTSRQTTILPLGSESGVPGALVSSTELYLFACHNFKGSINDAAARYGYQVQD